MRWIYLILIIVFVAAIVIFAFQNFGVVTVSFLSFSMSAPVALVVVVFYLLGAITGGSLFALLRRSYRGSGIGPAR